jgi:hypothetical protein
MYTGIFIFQNEQMIKEIKNNKKKDFLCSQPEREILVSTAKHILFL